MITVTVNQESVSLAEPCSVADYLVEKGIAGKRLAVELNQEIVPRSDHPNQMLAEGDRLEIIHAIGGG
ncbi:MAG: sulfur carrier protein ThiS [Immundisolibacteraceae bacterium]|nr:sulfur carrier protein ThiS [Immundisolibacteraceae bacterium]